MPTNTPKRLLKFTIVTVTYNAESFIDRTINSVEEQDYPYIEHLIIDGASKDKTCEKVVAYKKRSSLLEARHDVSFISEPDHGLYDAMNKAIKEATGLYLLFLNAGDQFSDNTLLSKLAKAILATDKNDFPYVVYGDTDIVDNTGKFIRHRRLSPPKHLNWKNFKFGMLVCHQSFMVRCDIAKQFPYDLNYFYSADYDWCIRLMKEAKKKHNNLLNSKLVITKFLEGGITTKQHKKSLKERFNIMCKHYGIFQTLCLHFWFILRAQLRK